MAQPRSIIKLILSIFRSTQSHIVPQITKFDVSRGQWYFLNKLLFEKDGLTQEELSQDLVVDSAHTARAIKNLEEKGLIAREKDKEDGRKKNIYVTDKALQIKDDYHDVYKNLNNILVQDFSQKEKEQLLFFLQKMENNIKTYKNTNDQKK